jgi:hypothetical protein
MCLEERKEEEAVFQSFLELLLSRVQNPRISIERNVTTAYPGKFHDRGNAGNAPLHSIDSANILNDNVDHFHY